MLTIKVRSHGDIVILDLAGILDLEGANFLREKIQEERQKGFLKFILNCSLLTNIMSTYLQNLLTPIRSLVLIRGVIAFCNLTPSNHKVLKTSMYYFIIKVFETEEEALGALTVKKKESESLPGNDSSE